MSDFDQLPFDPADFAENPEPRCQCLLLLDTSASMSGKPLEELNAGLVTFKDELLADSLAAKRVEVAIMTFGPVQLINDFQTPDIFQPPRLVSGGDTPMGAAILQGIDLIEQRKARYKENGIAYYRPWVFMITDGGPTDYWLPAAAAIKQGEAAKTFQFFAVGVEGADFEILKQLSVRQPLQLKGLRFRDLFVWLSNSLNVISRSRTDETGPLKNPAAPEGWASPR